MVIDQRNAGAAVLPTASVAPYPVDRWRVGSTLTSRVSAQRNAGGVTPPAGFSNYVGLTSTGSGALGSTDAIVLEQVIEGFNLADIAYGTASAASLTLSFWVRSSQTGNLGLSLATVPVISGVAAVRSYPTSVVINSANTWEYKTVVVPGDVLAGTYETGNGAAMFVRFMFGAGSGVTGTANSWQTANARCPAGCLSFPSTNGATLYITGVQLEEGTQATQFDYRPYGTELALCQRYYEVSYFDQSGYAGISVARSSFTDQWSWIYFEVQKRARPTVSAVNGTWSGTTPSLYGGLNWMYAYNGSGTFYRFGTEGAVAFSYSSEL